MTDIREIVKTFDDAAKRLGEHHWMVQSCQYTNDTQRLAFCKLRVIVAALNDGWTPRYTKQEERHYPIFTLFNVEKLERIPRYQRTQYTTFPIRDGYNVAYDYIAIREGVLHTENMQPVVPSSLLLRSPELAFYCGKTFIDLWAKYFFARKGAKHD